MPRSGLRNNQILRPGPLDNVPSETVNRSPKELRRTVNKDQAEP